MSNKKSDYTFNTPVLFVVFNRVEPVKKTFEMIRLARPPELYICADGPRNEKERFKTERVRKYILDNIDWKCNVKKLFREKNLGCKMSVSGGISWFFDNVNQGIVLEDDCVPSKSFFRFCQDLLEKYRDDERVMHITGSNIMGKSPIKESYFFHEGGGAWGWASWKRAWKKYDSEIKLWPKIKKNYLNSYPKIPRRKGISRMKSIKLYDELHKGRVDTWDYQWGFACFVNNGLGIVPKVNLITNIGFTPEGTHTGNYNSKRMSIPRYELKFPLRHQDAFVHYPAYREFGIKFFRKGVLGRVLKRGFRFIVK